MNRLKPGVRVNVFLKELHAGMLTRNKHDEYVFEYETDYVKARLPPISRTLPLTLEKFVSKGSLHPFFDNLASEGWLRENQIKFAGDDDKLFVLVRYGHDLIGAVHLAFADEQLSDSSDSSDAAAAARSPPRSLVASSDSLSIEDGEGEAVRKSRASISGVQKKLLVRRLADGSYRTTVDDELSTHIAKLSNPEFPCLIELEFLTSLAFKHLLPNDRIAEMEIGHLELPGQDAVFVEQALLVKRFDRVALNGLIKRRHFEEFNQLLGKSTEQKYDASYADMADFVRQTQQRDWLLPQLLARVLACILLNNTDAHLKNFAMFYDLDEGYSLTPMYDVVASAYYPQFQTMALKLTSASFGDKKLADIKPKDLVSLAVDGFDLDVHVLIDLVRQLGSNLDNALRQVETFQLTSIDEQQSKLLKTRLVSLVRSRWNGTFAGVESYVAKSAKLNKRLN